MLHIPQMYKMGQLKVSSGVSLYHSGTHYFRSINNSQQPWSSLAGRKKLGLKPVNPTEEGLASIHSVLLRREPRLWRAALLYYTVHQAEHMSFTQLFHELARFVHDPGTRWDYCVRAKRGQTDTSQPGNTFHLTNVQHLTDTI